MARKNRPVLPGLSRSTACSKTCLRLSGHKGTHRASLTAAKVQPTVRPAILDEIKAVEAILAKLRAEAKLPWADRMPTEGRMQTAATLLKRKAAKPKATAKPKACRVTRNGVRCARAYGHKQAGKRHSFAGVVVLPMVESPRMVADTTNGQLRTARRARKAPAGRRDVTIAESLA